MSKEAAEASIHDEIADFVERIAEEYGVRIDELKIGWINVSTLTQDKYKVAEIQSSLAKSYM